ncbi:putative vesicular transport protein, partial [Pseudoloma neurophilia]
MSETEDAISEKLKILNQRLLDSTYLEDKIESLEEIYHFTENFTNLVGIHCLSSLIKSLEQFVHKNHFQIFFKIFNSLNGKEFVEIFLKNTKYIENIINLKNKKGTELFLLLCQVDCEKVCEIFRDKPVFFEKLSDEKLNLLCILLKDKILRKKLIDYHLMEKLLHFIDEKRSVKKVAQIYEILLKNSHFSQNYFFENIINTEKYKIFYKLYTLNTFYFYDILTAALDTTNMKFVDHQARFTKKEFIDRAFVLKRYDFISKYFYNRYGKDQNAFFSNFSNVNRVSENVNRVSENVNQISENVNQISENVNRVSENEDVDSHQNHSHINYLKEDNI